VNQGSATGSLANNLRNLGDGLAAFADALDDEWNSTVMMVSEFGRTFRENGSNVNGGRIAGEKVAVDQ
jgi:uncharacterized protein (DUF1501 family)